MTAIMQGVRILEVAEHTFVPAASAALADLGAEVIKIEPIERGDAMRGLASTGVALVPNDIHVLLEHSNRGKKSLALDLNSEEGVEIVYQLAATADVFLTNKLPRVRTKLHIDVDDIRAHNPNIIYVRGTGQGDRGPDRDGVRPAPGERQRRAEHDGVRGADRDVIDGQQASAACPAHSGA